MIKSISLSLKTSQSNGLSTKAYKSALWVMREGIWVDRYCWMSRLKHITTMGPGGIYQI